MGATQSAPSLELNRSNKGHGLLWKQCDLKSKDCQKPNIDYTVHAVHLSDLVYESDPKKWRESPTWTKLKADGFENIEDRRSGGLRMVNYRVDKCTDVKNGKRTIFVTFRGSYELQDWLINFSPGLKYLPEAKLCVHATMMNSLSNGSNYDILDEIAGVIMEELAEENDAKLRPDSLVICGHSLGGAYAILTSVAFHKFKRFEGLRDAFSGPEGGNKIFVRTFGAPSIVSFKTDMYFDLDSKEDAKTCCDDHPPTEEDIEFTKRIHSYVNEDDPVPRLFSQTWLFMVVVPMAYKYLDTMWFYARWPAKFTTWALENMLEGYLRKYFEGLTLYTPLGKTFFLNHTTKDEQKLEVYAAKSYKCREHGDAQLELEKPPLNITNLVDHHSMDGYIDKVTKLADAERDSYGRSSYSYMMEDLKDGPIEGQLDVKYFSPRVVQFVSEEGFHGKVHLEIGVVRNTNGVDGYVILHPRGESMVGWVERAMHLAKEEQAHEAVEHDQKKAENIRFKRLSISTGVKKTHEFDVGPNQILKIVMTHSSSESTVALRVSKLS